MEVDPGSYRSLFLTTGCDSGGKNGLNIFMRSDVRFASDFLVPVLSGKPLNSTPVK